MGIVVVAVSVLMVSVGNADVGLADMVCSACIACGLEWLTIRTMWMAVARLFQGLLVLQRVPLQTSAIHLPQGQLLHRPHA